jgi:hypothetical protein
MHASVAGGSHAPEPLEAAPHDLATTPPAVKAE